MARRSDSYLGGHTVVGASNFSWFGHGDGETGADADGDQSLKRDEMQQKRQAFEAIAAAEEKSESSNCRTHSPAATRQLRMTQILAETHIEMRKLSKKPIRVRN